MKYCHVWSLLFMTLCFPFSASAFEEVTDLNQVVVTASRIEETKADQTTNVTVIGEEQIKESSAQDLADLLGAQGFKIREYPNSLMAVQIRGFATDTHGQVANSYVTLLLNGRRVNTGNLASIMMDNVERVEIIRGPGSVQYGSAALGGVVNVITKKGAKPSAFVEQTLGSWDYLKTTAGVSGKVNQFDYSLSASTSSQSSYDTGDDKHYDNTGFDAKDRFSTNLGWNFLPGQRIGLVYSWFNAEGIGSPNYLSAVDPDDSVNLKNRQVDVVYDGKTANDFLFWNLRYFDGKDEYETVDNGTVDYFRDTRQKGGNAQITAKWDLLSLTTGVDWIRYEISNSNMKSGKENSYDNPALFVLTKTKLLNDKLILSAGGRYDKFDIESDTGASTDSTNWSSTLGAAFKVSDMVTLRTNYAEGFKMPTPDQLFMLTNYSAYGWGIWSGNPDLDPEESATYEAGIDFVTGTFSASMTYFYTDFENKIGYEAVSQDLTRYQNIGAATLSGLEGSVQFDIGALAGWNNELIPYLSFTYLDKYEDDDSGDKLTYTSALSASYGLRFNNPNKGLSACLNFAYTGEQDITDYEKTGATKLKSFTVTDLSVTKTLDSFAEYGDLSLTADIHNLFNKNYAYNQGYFMPGRTFFVTLAYHY